MVAGRAGGRAGRGGGQLRRRDGHDDPRVAGRRGGRARRPADPRRGRRGGDRRPRHLGQAGARAWSSSCSWRPSSRGPAGWRRRSWWAPVVVYLALAATGVVAVSTQPSASPLAFLPLTLGFVTWLVVLSLLVRAAAPARARGRGRGREQGGPTPSPSRPVAGSCCAPARSPRVAVLVSGVGRVVGARSPPRRGDPAPAAAARRDRAGAAARGARRGRGHHAVGDAERRLLPRAHRDRRAEHRAARLAAADPRPRRPPARDRLRRPAGARAHRGVGDAQLRVQPGRRRPDRQRLVERRPRVRPARRRPGSRRAPTPCCRPPTTAGPAAPRWPR